MKPVIDFVCRAEKGKIHELQKQLEELKQNLQTTRMELASCTTVKKLEVKNLQRSVFFNNFATKYMQSGKTRIE